MQLQNFACPNCGVPLTVDVRANQLTQCSHCGATLLISDFQIGDTTLSTVVMTPTRAYSVHDLMAKDDLCNLYRCTFRLDGNEREGIFRVSRAAEDNDLVGNEARILYHLQSCADFDAFRPFVPNILEAFLYQDAASARPRQVNILNLHEQIARPDDLYTLEEVHRVYPSGMNPRDMAWIWRRVLNILGFAHDNGVIHAAPLPHYIQIEPKDHKVALFGWDYALRKPQESGERLRALSETYEDWYPAEVHDKAHSPTAALDICLGARTMLYLVGADPRGDSRHQTMESALQDYFRRCTADSPKVRPQTAWDALVEFDRLIDSLWGPRTYRAFHMPARSAIGR